MLREPAGVGVLRKDPGADRAPCYDGMPPIAVSAADHEAEVARKRAEAKAMLDEAFGRNPERQTAPIAGGTGKTRL